MSEVLAWFERKFTFEFPVELYANLRTRLRGTTARLDELLRGLSRDALTRQVEGKWSIQENTGHLLDTEELWHRRVEEYLAGATELSPADLTNRKTHQAQHNRRATTEILQEFRVARLRLVARLENLPRDAFARVALHPRLRMPMRLVDHMYFIAEHDDHHLARIWELRRASLGGSTVTIELR